MVEDRLGGKLGEASGNPWWKIHSPLMEYDELMLERSGQTGRIRPYGFVRLAYRDEVDGSPQFCRAYLPAGYDPAKKWPLVVQIHGYNGANPVYVRWWSADQRHADVDTEFSNQRARHLHRAPRPGEHAVPRHGRQRRAAGHRRGQAALQRRRGPRVPHGRFHGRMGDLERRQPPSRSLRGDRAGVRRRRLSLRRCRRRSSAS